VDHPQDPPPGSSSGSTCGIASFRDDKQETVVVRPYPQVQALGQPPALPQHVPIQPSPSVTVAAPSVRLLQGQLSNVSEASVKVIYFLFLGCCDSVKILKYAFVPASTHSHEIRIPDLLAQLYYSKHSIMASGELV